MQAKTFEVEVQHVWDILEMVYEDSKFLKGVVDFNDLAKRMKGKIKRRIKAKTGDPLYEDIEKSWSEVTFVAPGDTDVERMNRTYIAEKDEIKKRLIMMKDKLQKLYSFRYPIQRRVLESAHRRFGANPELSRRTKPLRSSSIPDVGTATFASGPQLQPIHTFLRICQAANQYLSATVQIPNLGRAAGTGLIST